MRRLLLRKKKIFFAGGILALLLVAGVTFVINRKPDEANAVQYTTVTLGVGAWTGTTNNFTINGRNAWCITPSYGTPAAGNDKAAVVYTYDELMNGQSSTGYDLTNIRKMFTAYYYTSENGTGGGLSNTEAMHWALSNLYSGSGRNSGENAGPIWDNGQKAFPANLETGSVTIIPANNGKQAIFTANYRKKTSYEQKLIVEKVWADGLDAGSHNVSIKFRVKNTKTNTYIKLEGDSEIAELNKNNNWRWEKPFTIPSGQEPYTFAVEEVLSEDDGFFTGSDGENTFWYHDSLTKDGDTPIHYFMPSNESQVCDDSDIYNVSCTIYNTSYELTAVNFWPIKKWDDAGYTSYRPETISYYIHAFIEKDGSLVEVEGLPGTNGKKPKTNVYNLPYTFVWGGVYRSGFSTKYYDEEQNGYDVIYAIEEVQDDSLSAYGLTCEEYLEYQGHSYCKAKQRGDGDYEVTWTNTIKKIKVTAKKNWVDGGNPAKRPAFIKFEIYRCTGACTEKTYYTTSYMTGTDDDSTWIKTLSLVQMDKDGNDYTYYYKEIDFFDGSNGQYISDGYIIDGSYIGFNEEDKAMTNRAKADIPVKKCWVDNDESHRPKQIKFNVYIVGTSKPLDEFGITLTAANVDEEDENCWSGSVDGLPAYDENGPLEYRVEEDTTNTTEYNYLTYVNDDEDTTLCEINAGNNFAADSDDEKEGCTFYNVELTDISVKKVWEEDTKEDRPGSIEVVLLCDGEEVKNREDSKISLSEANNLDGDNTWEYTWKDLHVADCKGEYSVAETFNIPGYKTKVTGNAEDGFVITNTKTLDEILTWGGLGAGSFGAIAAGFFLVKRKLFDR